MNTTITTVAVSAPVLKTNREVASLIDNAKSKYDFWNENSRETSRMDLYHVLVACYELYTMVKRFRLYSDLTLELKNRNLTCRSGTSLPTRVVRLVFSKDDRGLARYAAVLKIAEQQAVKSEGFILWVIKNGGLDAVRKTFAKDKAKPTHSNTDLYAVALDHLNAATSVATVPNKLLANISIEPSDGFVVSIARVCSNGDYEIVGATSQSSIVRNAMTDWGRFIINTEKTNTVKAKTAKNTQMLGKRLAELKADKAA